MKTLHYTLLTLAVSTFASTGFAGTMSDTVSNNVASMNSTVAAPHMKSEDDVPSSSEWANGPFVETGTKHVKSESDVPSSSEWADTEQPKTAYKHTKSEDDEPSSSEWTERLSASPQTTDARLASVSTY